MPELMAGKIIALSNLGFSRQKIQTELDRTKSINEIIPDQVTISRIIGKFRRHGTAKRLPGQGRKRKTDQRGDRSIIRMATANRKRTLKSISTEFSEYHGKSISRFTVSRRLKEDGFKVCRCTKKPLVDNKNRQRRLKWSKKMIDNSSEYWDRVHWSDESRFEFVSDRPQNCIRRSNERFRPDCLQTTVKHSGGGLMVWGCFSAAGVGALHRVKGTIKAIDYIDILDEHLIPTLNKFHPNGDGVFQQDNATVHTAKSVKEWFNDQEIDWIDDWPPQSPDINPIENLWDHIDRKLRVRTYANADQLWEAIETIWKSIPIDFCKKLVDSIPRRLQEVIDNKGGPTKY